MATASSSANTIDPYQPFAHGRTLTLTTTQPFIPTYLSQTLSPSTSQTTYTSRLKGKQLILDNPLQQSRRALLATQRAAARAREKERRERGVLGRKGAKRLGVWRLREGDARWELFWPIHLLWLGYITELVGLQAPPSPEVLRSRDLGKHKLPNVQSVQTKLVKADLHGSILSVKRAKNADLVGVGGIVLHETENTFHVVTAKDEEKVIPKRGSVFVLRVPVYAVRPGPVDGQEEGSMGTGEGEGGAGAGAGGPEWEFEMYGNQLCFRASERASRKFKYKDTIEL